MTKTKCSNITTILILFDTQCPSSPQQQDNIEYESSRSLDWLELEITVTHQETFPRHSQGILPPPCPSWNTVLSQISFHYYPLSRLSPDGAAHVAAEPVHGLPPDWVTKSHEARAGLEIEITEGSEIENQVWKET